jgi:hypothetical protein
LIREFSEKDCNIFVISACLPEVRRTLFSTFPPFQLSNQLTWVQAERGRKYTEHTVKEIRPQAFLMVCELKVSNVFCINEPKETITHGHDSHNTTILSIYTQHINYMFRPILFLAIIRLDKIIAENYTIYRVFNLKVDR